jgi:hypothetical protein
LRRRDGVDVDDVNGVDGVDGVDIDDGHHYRDDEEKS